MYGDDRQRLGDVAKRIEGKLATLPETFSVFADRTTTGYYLDITPDAGHLARYGVTKAKVMESVAQAIGGAKVGTLLDGLARYPISVRLASRDRTDPVRIRQIPIMTPSGPVPLGALAEVAYSESPSVIKSEKGLGVSYVYITPKEGISPDRYKKAAEAALSDMKLPEGFFTEWSGQSEYLEQALTRLSYIIPATLVLIFLLIYLALKEVEASLMVFGSLPFAIIGGLWLVGWLDYNLSVAVVVGFLALSGVAAETAIVMMIYLKEAWDNETDRSAAGLKSAVYRGAVLRLRPKLMTVFSLFAGLVPILFIDGVGSEIMRRIAAPMIGGMATSAILTLLLLPVLFYMLQRRRLEDKVVDLA